MNCARCGHDYRARNQHSTCPKCGTPVGDEKARGLKERHEEVCRWFEEWVSATAKARQASERDRDYYDGEQWTEEEKAVLKDRHQPAVVINRIFKKINYLLGDEVLTRTDCKAFPRTKAHDDDALAVTDGIRAVCDDQDFDQVSSEVWENELIDSYGGALVETEVCSATPPPEPGEATSSDDAYKAAAMQYAEKAEVEIRLRHVPWDRLWYDPHSRKADFTDALYRGCYWWGDKRDVVAHYGRRKDVVPNLEDVLTKTIESYGGKDASSTTEDKPQHWADEKRDRLRIVECYYKDLDPQSGELVWYHCHYTKAGFIIEPRPTGYKDEKGRDVCPLEMTSAFVSRQGLRYGLVRMMIGPQDEINKRRSKLLHRLSVRQMWSEEGAVLNPAEARTELAKPDGWIKLQPGALANGRFKVEGAPDMVQGEAMLLQEAKNEIDQIGPEAPMIGTLPGDQSGRALMARQNIGTRELAKLMDRHRRWKRRIYTQIWWRIRQFKAYEWWFRVRDDDERTGWRFVGLNRRMTRAERVQEMIKKGAPLPAAIANVGAPPQLLQEVAKATEQEAMMQVQQARAAGQEVPPPPPEYLQQRAMQQLLSRPEMQARMVANDVAQLNMDIVLDEAPDTAVLAQEEFQELAKLAPHYLNAGKEFPLDLLIEASHLPNKRKLLDRLREPPASQEQMQQQQVLSQLQVQQLVANVEATKAKAHLDHARAAGEEADAQLAGPRAQATQAQAMRNAAEAGHKAGAMPQAAG
jgi:hypothetical protein